MFMTRAGTVALSPIDADAADGWVDYRGPLVADLQFRGMVAYRAFTASPKRLRCNINCSRSVSCGRAQADR